MKDDATNTPPTTTTNNTDGVSSVKNVVLETPTSEAASSNVKEESSVLLQRASYIHDLKALLAITGPIILSEFFQNTLPVIDIAFVGNLPDKDDLAAASLATVWFNLWNATMIGFMTAIDTLLSQSYGAEEYVSFGRWTGTSLVLVCVVGVFVAGVLSLCGPAMLLFGQDEDLAARAAAFSYRLIPGLFPYFAFKVLVKYLQTQKILLPGVVVGLLANGINVFTNWLFIYELDMGLNGAPWATTVTRFLELALLVGYLFWNKASSLRSTWPSCKASDFQWTTLKSFGKLAISGALAMAAEAWSFEVATILAGLLGTVSLNAHTITLTVATFVYLSFPFGAGLATSIRVGHLIGEDRASDAKRSTFVSVIFTAVVQALLSVALFFCSKPIGDLFSGDAEVSALVATLIPISCVFMLGDAFHANIEGALRGLGRQNASLFLNILAFWVLAAPIGSIFTFVADIGVQGLWWGMNIGIYVSSLTGAMLLVYRIDWDVEARQAKIRISSNVGIDTADLLPS